MKIGLWLASRVACRASDSLSCFAESMFSDEPDVWIKRGAWHVNLARQLAAHEPDGCLFRMIDEPASAVWIDVKGKPPPLDQIPTMQWRAWAVFINTEKLVQTLRRRR